VKTKRAMTPTRRMMGIRKRKIVLLPVVGVVMGGFMDNSLIAT
jgi:hypothetical protein